MSTDRQDTSIADQHKAALAYAARHGLEVIRDYLDEGISGDDTEHRSGFRQMIADAKVRQDFQAVLCWDQDRFGRFDPIEAGYWIKPLRDAGVWLETVRQGKINWDDFSGRLMYMVTQEGKHAYLRDLSGNTLRTLLERARRGDWLGGRPPYGYATANRTDVPLNPKAKKKPKKLVPGDPYKVEVVRWIFKTYAAGEMSLRGMARELDRRGVPTPWGGKQWRPQVLLQILRRREYVGDYDWGESNTGDYSRIEGGEARPKPRKTLNKNGNPKRVRAAEPDIIVVEQTHEPLIDRETFMLVQARLQENRTRTTPHKGGGGWVLSGLLTCGHCGSAMHGIHDKPRKGKPYSYRFYRCGRNHEFGRTACHYHILGEQKILACLVRKLQDEFKNPDNLAELRAEIRRQEEQAENADPSQIKALKSRIAKLTADVAKGEANLPLQAPDMIDAVTRVIREWRGEREKLKGELRVLEEGPQTAELEERITRAEQQLWTLHEAVASADPSEVRAVLREAITKVELWWECGPAGKVRRRCPFARGIIHLRSDERLRRDVRHGSSCKMRAGSPDVVASLHHGVGATPLSASA
jgi:DNA invertase Pin-like site-specific DNA recombinase